MKNLHLGLLAFILLAFGSCSPKITTNLAKSYPPIDYLEEIVVIGLDAPTPKDAEILGQVKIGDSGFTTQCDYRTVLTAAKMEARKAGGNAIRIISHTQPNLLSTCHRITANILKLTDPQKYQSKVAEEILPNVDYAVINVYRYNGYAPLVMYDLHLGNEVICRVRNNFKTSVHIKKEGLNKLWAKTEARAEAPINVQIGKVYYLRCSVGIGAFVGRPKLELVGAKTGKAEFEAFKAKHQ